MTVVHPNELMSLFKQITVERYPSMIYADIRQIA